MVSPTDFRPDPDALLAQLREEDLDVQRGKLRIYFGSSAGVGKTFAMLSAAQRAKRAGLDVLVGVVETHGRKETMELQADLKLLPLRKVPYRGQVLLELDIDAALAAKPDVLLVDELAHSNAPGSRHPKRWQDVQELLDAGIDVWTALNVQHLESLNGTVGSITGIRVNETVPDTVLDSADELILVDVTAEELLARLQNAPPKTSSARAICLHCARLPCGERLNTSAMTCAATVPGNINSPAMARAHRPGTLPEPCWCVLVRTKAQNMRCVVQQGWLDNSMSVGMQPMWRRQRCNAVRPLRVTARSLC
jgi:hypothetical protein